jgi:hypothetical protein
MAPHALGLEYFGAGLRAQRRKLSTHRRRRCRAAMRPQRGRDGRRRQPDGNAARARGPATRRRTWPARGRPRAAQRPRPCGVTFVCATAATVRFQLLWRCAQAEHNAPRKKIVGQAIPALIHAMLRVARPGGSSRKGPARARGRGQPAGHYCLMLRQGVSNIGG